MPAGPSGAAAAVVAAALGPAPWRDDDWDRVADAVEAVLEDTAPAWALAGALAELDELLTVGRGFLYAAALETGLKVAETTGIHTSGWSTADLLHGPIAVAEPGLHALCLAAPGPVAGDVADVATELRSRGVTVHAIAEDPALVPAADRVVRVPAGVPEALAPLVGTDAAVAAFVAEDPAFPEFVARLNPLLDFLLPAYRDEGKSRVVVAFGCTGGRHRSVVLAELVARRVREQGYRVSVAHRHVARPHRPPGTPGPAGAARATAEGAA